VRRFINIVLLIALGLAIGTAAGFYSAWEKVRQEFNLYIDRTTVNDLTALSVDVINSIGSLAEAEDVERVSIKIEPKQEGKTRWLKAQFAFNLKPGRLGSFANRINSIASADAQNLSCKYEIDHQKNSATISLLLAGKFTVAEILLSSPAAPAADSSPGPRVAIIIDDLGYGGEATERLLSLQNVPLTLAILPNLPYSKEIAQRAHEAGFEIMLHLPMEPLNENIPLEKGTITCDMDDKQIRESLENALESIQWVVGVNNHMGSKATSDKRVMELVLGVLKEKGLFFVDSRTTPASYGYQMAKQLGLRCASRDIFLDGVDDEEYIKEQVIKLFELAKKRGKALGIGHVRDKTVDVLYEMLPEAGEKFGVNLVFASQILD